MFKKLSLLSVVLLSTLFVLTGCQKTENTVSTDQSNQPKIVKVWYLSYSPWFIVDPNTKKKSGIGYEILEQIGKRQDIKFEYVREVTWATMIEDLNLNQVDVIVYVRDTEPRRQLADMSRPMWFSPVWAYVRSNNTKIKDANSINSSGVRILAIDWEAWVTLAKTDYPNAKLITLPNTIEYSQLLLEIENNKADVVFMEPIYTYNYMKNNPWKLKNIAEKNPIINRPNVFLLKKWDKELKAILDKWIDGLLSDWTLDKILDKYEPFPWAIYRVK